MVKGAFSKKSKFKYTLFSPLALLETTFDLRNSDILFLKDIHSYNHFKHIPFDIVRNSILIFYNELVYKAVYQCHEDATLFHYVEEKLLQLDMPETSLGEIHIHFIIGLLRVMGIGIVNNYSEINRHFFIQDSAFQSDYFEHEDYLSLNASQYLSCLLTEENKIAVDKPVRMELLRFLLRYMAFHISGFKISDSLLILGEVLN
jgi:DNA repair protein RecO (recombination protein O)